MKYFHFDMFSADSALCLRRSAKNKYNVKRVLCLILLIFGFSLLDAS